MQRAQPFKPFLDSREMIPAQQMMASLARVFGTEAVVPAVLSSTLGELQEGLNPEDFNLALETLGHIAIRQRPETLANALRAGNIFTHAAANRLAAASEIGNQPYPWPVRVPFELSHHEVRNYASHRKSERRLARDCETFLKKFSGHVRDIQPQMAFPNDRILYGMIFELVSTAWGLCGVEPISHARRFQSLIDAFKSYLGGSIPDPRQWKTPASGKETLRDFYLFRLCGIAVNEMYYSNAKILCLNPLADQPPMLLAPLPFEDCRVYLFRLLHDEEAVKKALLRAGVGRYQFQHRGGHGVTERMLNDHFDAVPAGEPLQVNDVVAFPGSFDYFQEHGLSHVGRVVSVKGDRTWVESQWGLMTHPTIHLLEMIPLIYGPDLFVARPKDYLTTEPSRETIAEAGFRIPSGPPRPEDVLGASIRLASELRAKDIDWVHRHF